MSQKIPKVPCHKQKINLRSRGCPGFPVAGEWAFDRSNNAARSLSHSPPQWIYPKFGKPAIDQRSPVSSLRHTGGRRAIDRTLTRTQNSGRPTTIVDYSILFTNDDLPGKRILRSRSCAAWILIHRINIKFVYI